MAITISGENNNDKILAQDGVIDEISGINIVGLLTAGHINVGSNIQLGNAGIITATTFIGNVTGNVNSTSPLLLQTGGSERFRITGNNELGIAGANYGSSGQVLTSGGSGSAVTWSAIPAQATIANNADNRVITGGSGVNLNGESSFTYDGNGGLDMEGTGSAFFQIKTANNTDGGVYFRTGSTNAGAVSYLHTDNSMSFRVNSTTKLKITSDGDVGINQASPSTKLEVGGGSILVDAFNTSGDHGIFFRRGFNSTSSPYNVSILAYDHSGSSKDGLSINGYDGISFCTGSNTRNERLRITSTGQILIGTGAIATPKASVGGLDVASGLYSIVMGGEANTGDGTPRANSATKEARLCVPHYTNAEEPLGAVVSFTQSGSSYLRFGGGSSIVNAATEIGFYTAANTTTTGGTERLRIDSNGKLIVGTEYVNAANADAAISLYISGSRGSYGGLATSAVIFDNQTAAVDKGGTLTLAGYSGTSAIAKAAIRGGNEGSASTNAGYFAVFTRPASGNLSEKLRIDSSGNLLIGRTSWVDNHFDNGIYLAGSTQAGMKFMRTASGSAGTWDIGIDTDRHFKFVYAGDSGGTGAEKLRLANDGELFVGASYHGYANRSTLLSVTGPYQDPGGVWTQVGVYSDDGQAAGKGGTIGFGGQDGSTPQQQFAAIKGAKENGTSGNYAGYMSFYTRPDNAVTQERLRIDSSGDILLYRFSALFGHAGLRYYNTLSGGPQVQISRANGNPFLLNRNSSDGEILDLRRGWGAGGSIHVGTNSATYNTSSDYRLKENIVPISDGIARLKTLKPSRFNWIGDTSSTRDGFIAHEVTAVPEAITGTKDEVYSEDEPGRNIKAGDPKYQGIDQSRLVPLLVAALQEAIARIEALEGS